MRLGIVACVAAILLLPLLRGAGLALFTPGDTHWIWTSTLSGLAAGLLGFAIAARFAGTPSLIRSALVASGGFALVVACIDIHLRVSEPYYHGTMPPLPIFAQVLAVCGGFLAAAAILPRLRTAWRRAGEPR